MKREESLDTDLDALEFGGIQRLLERLTVTPYGADAARTLRPAPDQGQAQAMQAAVSAARRAVEGGAAGPARLPDIRAALRQAAQAQAALPGTALAHIAQVLQAGAVLGDVQAHDHDLYPDAQDLVPAPALEAQLRAAVLPTGRLRDTASPGLQQAAARLAAERQAVEAILKERLAALGLRDQDEALATAGARLLLSLPAALADTVKGVRCGPAAQGRRYLVEPLEAVAANNRLEARAGERDREELWARRELTALVREAAAGLDRLLGAIAWIDLAFAAAQISIHMNAVPPRFDERPLLHMEAVYHPAMLLAFADRRGQKPVPLSITLDAERPMLLVTGPNTGGKTVVLKTVGLLVAMAYCGLHLPSEGEVVIGRFTRLIVDIGDRQNILHQLSTFAAHVEILKRLLSEADGETLVLMDELGTGTDPEEGAALAMAVLDELARRGVRGLITTHLSPLKGYADRHAHLTNATMRFDAERLAPTYELEIGASGSSHGLTIAERRGLSPELLQAARHHLTRLLASRPAP